MKNMFFIGFGFLVTISLHAQKPNILFITVDDMNLNSVGVFGSKVKETTPAIDKLASEGMMFWNAHTQVANCMPSRNVMLSGKYPHNNGVEGFYSVPEAKNLLPKLLKNAGYFTGIRGKVHHMTPYTPYDWDIILKTDKKQGYLERRKPNGYYHSTKEAIKASQEANKPFFLVVNIADPHKPFFGVDKKNTYFDDPVKPSKIFKPEEVEIPAFLADHPEIKKEIAHYYSSVRRADDAVHLILQALKESGEADNTIIVFLSDHGMPFPFAKTCLYRNSTHTPLIVKWPNHIKAGKEESNHMVSAIDLLPTLCEAVKVDFPEVDGVSFLPLLQGKSKKTETLYSKSITKVRDITAVLCVVLNLNAMGTSINPWADGKNEFKTATTSVKSYKIMQKMAEKDERVAARIQFFKYRTLEEFYDYEKDPDALTNLIDDPNYADLIAEYREKMEEWMKTTNDHALVAFQNLDNPEIIAQYIHEKQSEADSRLEEKKAKKKAKMWKRKNKKKKTK